MINSNFTIREMKREEVDLAIEWAAIEGWNPGLADADSFFIADTKGFLIGLVDNKPVAIISAIKYGTSFGFIGFYIVKPEYRGKGYGIRIWNAALKYLEGRNIGLDGVVDQQDNYKKSGFKLAYRNIRYSGVVGSTHFPNDLIIVDLAKVPFNEVNNYDKQFFPDDRMMFLMSWISQPKGKAIGALNKTGKLIGYGVIRECRSGYKIGPLFADSHEIAESLLETLKSNVPEGTKIFLDIPEVNAEAIALVKRYNMEIVFETARMYTGEIPELPVNKIFGVTTFELG